jgi:hypothetical protein
MVAVRVMRFKYPNDERDFLSQPAACNLLANAKLKELIALIERFTRVTGCGEITITSYYRPLDYDSYHSILQAADIRSKDKPNSWKEGIGYLSLACKAVEPTLQIYMHPELKGTPGEHIHVAIKDGAIESHNRNIGG